MTGIELQAIQFQHPWWMLIVLQPLLMRLIHYYLQRRQALHFAEAKLHPWIISKTKHSFSAVLRSVTVTLTWILFAIALAGPRLPVELPEPQAGEGLDIFLVVDLSRSMQAMDIPPSRLKKAKSELINFVDKIQKDRIGIIVYAARPHLYLPLTTDKRIIEHFIRQIDQLVLPSHGSQPGVALEMSLSELKSSKNQRALVWLTDGDLNSTPSVDLEKLGNVMAAAKQSKTPVFVLGMGSVEGDGIPSDRGKWLQDNFKPVTSRMNEQQLRHFAELSGGRYSTYKPGLDVWVNLYDQGVALLHRSKEFLDDPRIQWQELYPWALTPALILFVLITGPIRFNRNSTPTLAILVLAISGFAATSKNVQASDDHLNQTRAAYQALSKQDYTLAMALYEKIPGYDGQFGLGVSYYHLGKYEQAITAFTQAVITARSESQRVSALFNLANSYFKSGNYLASTQTYRDVLRYKLNHEAAKLNLQFSTFLLKELEKRMASGGSTGRMGSGPRQSTATTSIDINPQGSVSIDESSPVEQSTWNELSTADSEQFELLIQRGLAYAELAAQGSTEATDSDPFEHGMSLMEMRTVIEGHQEKPALLWKSIFEYEEGNPAPLEHPRQLPGVPPW